MIRCVIDGLPVADPVEQAGVPCFAGLEFEFETDAAVGIDRLSNPHLRAVTVTRRLKVLVHIGDRETCSALRPRRGDAAAPDDTAGLHFEKIGKIAAYRDLEIELHLAHTVIDQIEILVDSAADGTADR